MSETQTRKNQVPARHSWTRDPMVQTPLARSRNLVFTSAGDRSNLRTWLQGPRDFDLWIVYYGDDPGTFPVLGDFQFSRKGSKFQNLYYCYQQWPQTLARYEAVMAIDDDIIIDASAITRLFEIRRQHDLWALQPAFRWAGKVSWGITAVHATAKLRYTNFLEMACPLIRRDKLDAFMAVYDPQLVGYGADWWFLHTLGPDLKSHVAVVDEVTCINPFDSRKGGVREIDTLQSHEMRKEVWEHMKRVHGLRKWKHVEFGRVPRPPLEAAAGVFRYFPERAFTYVKRVAWKVMSRGTQPDR